MGFSCDFSQLTYTLDSHCSYAVRHAFVQLFNEGLIYRGLRLVNWDPVLMTALGDEEVVNKEINGHLYTIRYPLCNQGKQDKAFIPVATTRPETLFGDVAVAVHPDDERYQSYIGSQVHVPLCGRTVPVIADTYVKSDFGSGALKITPAHDPNDYEIGKRHQLESISIFDDRARLNDQAPEPFCGMDRFEARKSLIAALKEKGLFDSSTPHRYSAPHSDRSKALIEPKLCSQWYVKTEPLAAPVAQAARDNAITFYPGLWKKTWLYWLDNIQDWCISRQLWWGHRIPIWYCQNDACKEVFASSEDPTRCPKCNSSHIIQEEDVLDTWFSSWLWPLSPFGWPKDTTTLERFYPSDVIITGSEIIFQWVARMVMAGIKFQGTLPFNKVYFNATVCDMKGQKFSKTLGNGIDPIDVIEQYGADALRYTAAHLSPVSGRIKMEMKDFAIGRNFITKLWNGARYLLSHCHDKTIEPLQEESLELWHKGLLHELYEASHTIDNAMVAFRMHDAHKALYQLIWNSICDWGIEASKFSLKSSDSHTTATNLSVMLYVYECALRLIHPLIPFVTEELIHYFPKHPNLERSKGLCVSLYPSQLPLLKFEKAYQSWQVSKELITSIRRLIQTSTLAKLSSQERSQLHVWCHLQNVSPQARAYLEASQHLSLMASLSQVAHIDISTEDKMPPCALVDVSSHFEIAIALQKTEDIESQRDVYLEKQKKVEIYLGNTQKKLSSQGFLRKADPQVIENVKQQQAALELQKQAITKTLLTFGAS